jgi:hypothetical protein
MMRDLNWGLLTDDLLEILVLNQTQLSEMCKVTQQSVSNWKTGVRSPGVYARHVLRELAVDAKIKLENYSIKSVVNKASAKQLNDEEETISEEVLLFAQRLSLLPQKQRMKIIDMAEFLIEHN